MGGNVQCPVCTLFLLPGMDLSDHLETHPKEQVIKALVQMSLKSEVSEIVTPDTPSNKTPTFGQNDVNARATEEDNRSRTPTSEASECVEEISEKRRELEENVSLPPIPQHISMNKECGYLFENNNSNSSSSSSSNIFGPPTPYYHQHNHQQQQQQQLQQQHQQHQHHQQHNHHQQQSSSSQHHLQSYHPYHGHPHGGSNTPMGPGPSQPPLRLFSYQQPPKPLQPPPAYGAAISQLRSQNSQSQMVNNVNRTPYSPANYTPTSSASTTASPLSATSSRLPPPLPPPPLNQRYQPSFTQMNPSFTDSCDNSAMSSPRRTSMTPPVRAPPQLYRSPMSSSGGQYSRQSSSPYSVMTGSPSVLRFAESPVTAHYLERENGDFIVQETPKHVVECVEKDDGEFSVIERVYHMPPSVLQINEDHDDDRSIISDQGSNSEDMKMLEDDRPSGTWSGGLSPEQQIDVAGRQKNSGITVLSDVQLDINEYLDLMGNIIASSKVAKTRTELIKIEKFEPDEVKEEIGSGAISPDIDEDVIEDEILPDNDQKPEDSKEGQFDYRNKSPCCPVPMPYASPSVAEPQDVNKDEILPAKNDQKPEDSKDEEFGYRDKSSCCPVPTLYASPSVVVPASSVTSVIRLAANPHARSNTPSIIPTHQHVDETRTDSPETKDEKDAAITTETLQITKVEEDVTICMETAKPNAEVATTSTDATTTAKVEKSTNEPQPQTDKIEDTDTPQIQEKSLKQEENPQFPSYHQLFRRPVKKTPKKLIIKPRSKPHTPPSVVPPSVPLPTPIEEEKSPIAREPTPQKEEVVTQVPETTKEDKLDDIKSENLPAPATAESLPPPLYADADEKIPPDDDVQPSTSNGILPMQEEVAVSVPSSTVDDDKPTADLTAFLDQCMKKEEEAEEQQMQTIFTIQITDAAEMDVSGLSPPSSPHAFPSASLFSKPTNSIDNMSTSESVLPDSSDMHEHDLPHPEPSQSQHQQNNSAYVEYPFSFLYSGEANHQEDSKNDISPPMYCSEDFNKYSASTSGGNSASCTWYQSQSSENDFEIDGKGSYLDLDSCKRSASFAAATEGSMPTTDTLNIRTDEKMPAKGEISEQESNCGVENSWSQPLYNEFPVRFPNPYQTFMTTQESWSNENFFRPQDLSSSVETKNFSLRLVEESPIMDALPSTSKRKNKPAVAKVPRKKTFQCAHCSLNFPLLKEKNAHLIKQHGYKRVNRRLVRDPPTSTVTTATMYTDAGASLLLGLEPSPLQLPPLAEEEDSKAAIVKIEQDNKEPKDCKNTISSLAITSTVATPTTASVSRTKYDSMRARDNRMLINFNLNALNVKNEGKAEGEEAQSYYQESKSSFVCFVCRKDFLTVKLFDEHLAEHPAECYRCHKTFTRWKNFMVHLKRHLGWKDFGCTICEKKFVIRSALVEHMRMHTGQTPLKCKICGKSFKRYSNLTQHRKRHGNRINRNKEYVCYCGEVLPSKARFIWHKETHDSKPKCCPYCRDRFVHANSLRRHIRLAHSEKFDYTEPMECPMCKQIYAKSSIKAHMATHSMDTQHDCPICNKSFSTKWNLKIHSWVHANRTTKPFKCDQCVKAFVREVDYNNHINSHKQIKPYTCEHCGCKFIRKYNYIRHRREHHGNKKFTCDLCGKLFHRHYYLIEHRRIHTGERPFQCTICGKSSTTKTNHNKHLKIHHSRDPFTSEA